MTRQRWIHLLAAVLLMGAPLGRGRANAQDRSAPAPSAAALQQAEEEKKQAITAARKLGPGHSGALAAAYTGLADVYLKQARMTEANLLLEQALLLLAETPKADPGVLDRAYQQLATVREFQGNAPEAQSLLKLSLAVRERRLGPDHPDVANALDRLADVSAQDPDAVLALRRRASAILDKQPRQNAAAVIHRLEREAEWCEISLGGSAEAEEVRRRMLRLQETTLGATHPSVADTLMKIAAYHVHLTESGNLGALLTVDDEKVNDTILAGFREYEPMLAQARAIREKALGPDHADTIETLQYLAPGYAMQHDWARALPLYERIVAAREKTMAREDPRLAAPLAALARVTMAGHRYRDAIPILQRLVKIQTANRAKDSLVLGGSRPLADGVFPVGNAPYMLDPADDPKDYAAILRKATRYAELGLTAASMPTAEDLAYLKAEGWSGPAMDLDDLLHLSSFTAFGPHVDNAALERIRSLVNLRRLALLPGAKPQLDESDQTFVGFTNDAGAGIVKPNIDDAGLAQLRNLTLLEGLDLKRTAIRGTGLTVLARMDRLKILDLSGSLVDDAGLASLPALTTLSHLNLNRTGVSDASLPQLKKFAGLTILSVAGTQISPRGVEELQRALPNARVYGPLARPPGSRARTTK